MEARVIYVFQHEVGHEPCLPLWTTILRWKPFKLMSLMSLIESNLSLFEFILSLKRVFIVFWTTWGDVSIVISLIIGNLPCSVFYQLRVISRVGFSRVHFKLNNQPSIESIQQNSKLTPDFPHSIHQLNIIIILCTDRRAPPSLRGSTAYFHTLLSDALLLVRLIWFLISRKVL